MSAPRRDSSQSPDPTTGQAMSGSIKNGIELITNGQVVQSGEYDQWRSHSIYSHNGSFGPLTPPQAAPISGDYVTTNYFTTSPYAAAMNDHHGGWTTAPPPGSFYHPQGLASTMSNQYVDHLTLFGGGPGPGANSFYYNYFPTNGSDYSTWGGPSIIAAPGTVTTASKHSEFYYNPMTDGGYTHYVGDIVGNGSMANAIETGPLDISQQAANIQVGYLEQGVTRMSVYEEANVPRNSLSAVTHYGNGGNAIAHAAIGDVSIVLSQQHSSVNVAEPKKKSWATVASQPAKPNTGGSPAGVCGKGKGRIPIGGAPGSAINDSTNATENNNDFWTPPPQTQLNSTQQTPVKSELENASAGVVVGLGPVVQSTQKSQNATSTNTASVWNSTNVSLGKSTKHVMNDGINNSRQSIQANGDRTSENEDDDGNPAVNCTESKPTSTKQPQSDSQPKQQQQNRVVDKLIADNGYNPKELNLPTKGARFFVIKSYSEDDVHRSIKYGIWCSTEHGNKRLDGAYKEREGKGPVYLLFSVNGSGHFCGLARMTSALDYTKNSGVWAQDKWKGQFSVKWIYVKDVPNAQLRHIRLENNENKPVTNSRDTQEVPSEKGRQVLKIVHQYRHTTSLFDDFGHYEKRQEEEDMRKNRRTNTNE